MKTKVAIAFFASISLTLNFQGQQALHLVKGIMNNGEGGSLGIDEESPQDDCDCYVVNAIKIPSDTTGVIDVTISNYCSNHVYLDIHIISDSGDTLASTNDTASHYFPPDSIPYTIQISSYITSLPPFGTYRVSIIGGINCWSISFSQTGLLEQLFEPSFSAYPNPATRDILIKGLRGEYFAEIVYLIFDGEGSLVQRGPLNRAQIIDIRELTPGGYIIQLISGRTNIGSRLLIIQ